MKKCLFYESLVRADTMAFPDIIFVDYTVEKKL
jgi:hypothetical protein